MPKRRLTIGLRPTRRTAPLTQNVRRQEDRDDVIPNMRPFSETLFEQLCSSHGIPCERIATEAMRTPDFAISLRSIPVICEVKQIDPNVEDLQEMQNVSSAQATGRFVPNRLRAKLKNVSGQLKAATLAGSPTMLVVYDNTPFKMYTDHLDVAQAMFGAHSVAVSKGRCTSGRL